MARTPKTQTTIAELASKAKTALEHLEVVQKIEAALDAEEEALDALEASRGDVVLSGTSIDEYHQQIRDGVERIKTLSAGQAKAQKRYEAALAQEAEQNLIERTEAVKAKQVPALTEAYRKLHTAMESLLAVTADIESLGGEIENHNGLVEMRGRPDLAVSIGAIKGAAKLGLGLNETAIPVLEQAPDEPGAAFALRQANAQHRALRQNEISDPIKTLGLDAMIALQRAALDMGAHEQARNFRLVSVQKYQMPDGHVVEKFIDADPAYKTRHHKVRMDGVTAGYIPDKPQLGTASAKA